MDTDSEIMYSTADVAKRLGVGSAMVRKWALAYEKTTGDKVRLKSKRDGREFTGSQVNIISAAKNVVDTEGLKVDTALKVVTGKPELASVVPVNNPKDKDTLQLLEAILERNDKTNQLLLEEIKGLRADFKQLQAKQLTEPKTEGNNDSSRHRLLVKAVMQLESWLKK